MEGGDVLDATFHHPFTCIVAGPTSSGKSTFVKNLLLHQDTLINTTYDNVIILLGTDATENTVLTSLKKNLPSVLIVEVKKMFPTNSEFCADFPSFFNEFVLEKYKGQKNCVIFDDLMYELAECNILVDMFTKKSSHSNLTTIFITQNIFWKGTGKHAADNVTIYRNTQVLVLFQNPMDSSVFATVAKRLSPSRFKHLQSKLLTAADKYRYIVIQGDFRVPQKLRYSTQIFNDDPVPHKIILTDDDD